MRSSNEITGSYFEHQWAGLKARYLYIVRKEYKGKLCQCLSSALSVDSYMISILVHARPAGIKKTKAVQFRNTKPMAAHKRKQIRERDKNLCQICLLDAYGTHRMYTYDYIEVNHIIPINEDIDKALDDNNLICLLFTSPQNGRQGYHSSARNMP